MKLLLDQNLSPSLIQALSGDCPGSVHVRHLGLASGTDQAVWDRARTEGLVIVSKDSDFRQMSFLLGAPPEVVWIRLGNGSTAEILALLRDRESALQSFWDGFPVTPGHALIIPTRHVASWFDATPGEACATSSPPGGTTSRPFPLSRIPGRGRRWWRGVEPGSASPAPRAACRADAGTPGAGVPLR